MNEKKKKFKILNINRDSKGLSKTQAAPVGSIKRFFISYKDNFGKITSVNIFMVLGNFPILFLVIALSTVSKLSAFIPSYDVFQNLAGYFASTEISAHSMSMFANSAIQNLVYRPTTLTYVFYALGALTLLSFGCVNAGTAYILRNIAKGDPVFLWSDFWYAVKRNWKQALPFGMIDLLITFVLAFNIYSMFTTVGNFFSNTMLWCNVVILILYFVMRYYVYVQMVTFNLTIFKILKNSLIFSLLGFKRNLLATISIILLLLIECACVFGAGGILLPFGISLPFLILFSTMAYMKVYASYFKIKEIMIDPYLAEHPEERDDIDYDPIMLDDVTEAERLENIKKRMH